MEWANEETIKRKLFNGLKGKASANIVSWHSRLSNPIGSLNHK